MKYTNIVDNEITFIIHLSITKKFKFRVQINERLKIPYEVTIGGNEWKKGKGGKYKDIIKNMSKKMIERLNEEYNKI